MQIVLLFLIGCYRTIGTNWLGGGCRFEPSCSDYASESIKRHEIGIALMLIGRRVLSCRPGGRFGYDPVPEADGARGGFKFVKFSQILPACLGLNPFSKRHLRDRQ